MKASGKPFTGAAPQVFFLHDRQPRGGGLAAESLLDEPLQLRVILVAIQERVEPRVSFQIGYPQNLRQDRHLVAAGDGDILVLESARDARVCA